MWIPCKNVTLFAIYILFPPLVTRFVFACLFRSLYPLFIAEIKLQCGSNGNGEDPEKCIAITFVKLRHVIEVHAIDPREKLSRQKHGRDHGQCVDNVVHLGGLGITVVFRELAAHLKLLFNIVKHLNHMIVDVADVSSHRRVKVFAFDDTFQHLPSWLEEARKPKQFVFQQPQGPQLKAVTLLIKLILELDEAFRDRVNDACDLVHDYIEHRVHEKVGVVVS